MKDLLFFVCFIFIFLLAFSITSWSLLTTNDQVTWTYDGNSSTPTYTLLNGGSGLWSWQLIRNVTNYGVWKIFGQVDPIGKKITDWFYENFHLNFISDGQDAYSAIAFVLAILFLAIANVLLLNVLVALFKWDSIDVRIIFIIFLLRFRSVWQFKLFRVNHIKFGDTNVTLSFKNIIKNRHYHHLLTTSTIFMHWFRSYSNTVNNPVGDDPD